jgi:acyl carrier protein
MDLDVPKWVRAHPDTSWGLLAKLLETSGEDATAASGLAALAGCNEAQCHALVVELVTQTVARVFGMAPEDLDASRGLNEYGLDSLMAVEMRSALEDAGMAVSTMELLSGRSIDDLARQISPLLRGGEPDETAGLEILWPSSTGYTAVSEDGPASELQDFYRGRTVFLTGATGFVGKCVLEKLIRDTEVSKIFVLIRSLPGSSKQQRVSTSILQSPVFERLRNKVGVKGWHAFIAARVQPVEGDISMPKIGMCSKDYEEVSPAHVPFSAY